ncbi:MAG TPA: M14 family metallopeptidase [Lentimicrobium sp.]|nr:M14 family metallopeptidase [Lentimicrobium sp.]
MTRISTYFLFISLLIAGFNGYTQDWQTRYEKSGYKDTPRYDETMDYCQRLNQASPLISMISLGRSPQGRDIQMMIVDKDGLSDPKMIRDKGRIIVLIESCIHPGEPEGKDASMMLVRDMIVDKKNKNLLEKVSLLVIPIFNVDGHERFGPYNRINQNGPEEMGWRTTATNLNLNRDFVKADAPEMRHWLKMYNTWLPDFFIDIHTTDGADYQYELTYDVEKYGYLDSGLTRWLNDIYEPRVEKGMTDAGFKIFPYVQFRKWHDPRSGLRKGAAPPLVSTGYAAAQNRPSVLVETHMLKDYKTRVSAVYQMIVQTLAIVNHQSETLKTLISMADKSTSSPNFRKTPLPVSFTTSQKDSVMVDFKGFDYTIKKSDLTGGDWFVYDPTKPITMRVPFFNKNVVEKTVKLPSRYIVPVEWSNVIDLMELHGVKFDRLEKDSVMNVIMTHFPEYEFRKSPYEGRIGVTVKPEEKPEKRLFPKGSAVVNTDQRTAKIIAFLLEPTASGSLVEWGFFNTVFEQKEYSETYVMEKMAREMLATDPQLKKEFDETVKNNPKYQGKPDEMLNWFYNRSKYQDINYLVYPVGKIY